MRASLAIVYVLFADAESARTVAHAVVTERLAACANILQPCTSIYVWQGRLEEAGEVPALFKTTLDMRSALMARLAELHGYDVPAIISWDASAVHPPYAQWAAEQVAHDPKVF